MGGPNEGLRLFINQIAGRSRLRVHFDEAESLMAAVHFFIGDPAAVFAPVQSRKIEIDALHGWLYLLEAVDGEQVQLERGQLVARQIVRALFLLCPAST